MSNSPVIARRSLLAAAAYGLLPSFASAETVNLRLAIIPVPGSFYTQTIQTVPNRIAKATNGAVKVEIFDSLIPGNQLANAVREGRVDMIGAIHPYLSSEEPRLTVNHLPGLIDSATEYRKALESGWSETMDNIWLTKYNAVRLMDGMWAPQGLWSRKPIHKVEDFKGLRVRVHNNETANLMTELGAKPTPISASEMLPALERGVIDAIFTSIDVANGAKFGSVATNVSLWPFSSVGGFAVLMNQDAWKKLPPNLQASIRKEMSAMQEEHFAHYADETGKLIATWKASKINFYEVPAAEAKRIYDPRYSKPVYDAWIKRTQSLNVDGAGLLKKLKAALGKEIPA
jgi:TRAP-type C4-dicarboxylate transport system substrate-binding protein